MIFINRDFVSFENEEQVSNYFKDYVDNLIKKDISQGGKNLILEGFCFGDWLALDGVTETSVMGGTDLGYIMSIYYYVSVDILTKAAKELGENDDYNRYTEQKEKIYNAILSQFFALMEN